MSTISKILGIFFRFIYDVLAKGFPEPKNISFFAITIIISTLIIRILMLPIGISQMKNQKKMAELQPELEKIQKKYKSDPQTMAAKQRQLYKDANYNMLSGCLPMIVQMMVLIGFYRMFYDPATYVFKEPGLYDSIAKNFFYIKDIDIKDTTLILPIVAAVTTFLSSWITQNSTANKSTQTEQSQSMMNTMTLVMPVMIFMMGRNFASALVLYWTVSNIFQVFQQLIQNAIIKREVEGV